MPNVMFGAQIFFLCQKHRPRDSDRKKPPPGGFPIYYVPSSRTVCGALFSLAVFITTTLSKPESILIFFFGKNRGWLNLTKEN